MAETILQFGTGRFLRAFVDRFVQQAQEAGQSVGRILAVQSMPGRRAELLNRDDGFHVAVRGYQQGELIDRVERVESIGRAVAAAEAWPQILKAARHGDLELIVSNTTEAGYTIADADRPDLEPPDSFPGKLTAVLWERFQARQDPLTLAPCELLERNGQRLKDLIHEQAGRWGLPGEFRQWLDECVWLNTLVDCIVTSLPDDHPLRASDPAAVQAEPFAFWGIERQAGGGLPFRHPNIHEVDDLIPYQLRKVRILNGLHTAMVAKFLPQGFETVQDVLNHAPSSRWVRELLDDEIVPVLKDRVPEVTEFADAVWDRLRNPFLQHRLEDIALNHAAKVPVRLQLTYDEYCEKFGDTPPRLREALDAGRKL